MKQEGILLPEVDIFKQIYYELADKVEPESEARKRDLSEELQIYIRQKIEYNELIVIELKGEVGTGKSTAALQLQLDANKLIEQIHKKKINNFRWIASDQIEFTRLTKTKEEHVCVEVDEFSDMAMTGANATTEIAEFKFFSNVCRVQYIHRIMCSPATIIDHNTHVILTIIGANKKEQKTQVKVTYRNIAEQRTRVLGSAWIDVSGILKEKYYKDYEKKKQARIDLMQEIGVRDIRELEHAMIALKAIQKLKERAKKGKITISRLRLTINKISRRLKLRQSMIAEDEIVKPVHAIIDMITEMGKEKDLEEKKLIAEEINEELRELNRLKEAYVSYINIQ